MRIQALINKLEKIKKKRGNVKVVVDTQAVTFPCHLVDVDRVWDEPALKDSIYLSLDPKIMKIASRIERM